MGSHFSSPAASALLHWPYSLGLVWLACVAMVGAGLWLEHRAAKQQLDQQPDDDRSDRLGRWP
jgi:hypothetical protein